MAWIECVRYLRQHFFFGSVIQISIRKGENQVYSRDTIACTPGHLRECMHQMHAIMDANLSTHYVNNHPRLPTTQSTHAQKPTHV